MLSVTSATRVLVATTPVDLRGPKALEIYRKEKLDIPFICVSGRVGEEAAVGMIRSGVLKGVF
jgi:hypothetical protein